jgi:hypothetical protein
MRKISLVKHIGFCCLVFELIVAIQHDPAEDELNLLMFSDTSLVQFSDDHVQIVYPEPERKRPSVSFPIGETVQPISGYVEVRKRFTQIYETVKQCH